MRRRTSAVLFVYLGVALAGCSPSDPIVGGTCTADVLPGDLAISEVFANPSGDDGGKEWFEIYNASDAPIELAGVNLVTSKDDGTGEKDHRMTAVTIGPGEFLVVGNADMAALPGHVDYTVENDLGDLRNTTGRIAIFCGMRLVDEVKYASVPDGAARQLTGPTPDAAANDTDTNWCAAQTDFDGGKGTPGAANATCGGSGGTMCLEGSAMRAIVPPAAGDLVITEWHANPTGADDEKEWFEVLVNRDVDFNGLQLGTAPPAARTTISDGDCLRHTAGSRVLFARNATATMNGGLPAVDHLFTFALGNSNATLFVGVGGVVVDQVMYASAADGTATQLDASKTGAADNDVAANLCAAAATYGDGDRGTPRAANRSCGATGPECNDGGTMRAIVAPTAGDLVITEWMADPNMVTDALGEWFEVLVTRNVDLNGLQLGTDAGNLRTTLTSTDCLEATAGSYVVFGRNEMSGMNGGLPAVNHRFDFDLVNSSRGIAVAREGTVIDAVTYTTAARGSSTQVKPDKLSPTENDVADNLCPARAADTYGLGDHGTPGRVNACM